MISLSELKEITKKSRAAWLEEQQENIKKLLKDAEANRIVKEKVEDRNLQLILSELDERLLTAARSGNSSLTVYKIPPEECTGVLGIGFTEHLSGLAKKLFVKLQELDYNPNIVDDNPLFSVGENVQFSIYGVVSIGGMSLHNFSIIINW